MEFAKVSVEVRTQPPGKGGARKVRAAGKVPGVLYGRKREPIAGDLRREGAAVSRSTRRSAATPCSR